MGGEWLCEALDPDRDWLGCQPRMNPWPDGCAMVRLQLDDWLAEYTWPLLERMQLGDHSAYGTRLWGCWRHHWRQAAKKAAGRAADGQQVGARIRAGRGYSGGGQLGGDPLADIVLTTAMLKHERRAIDEFQEQYFQYAQRIAGRVDKRFAAAPDEWWNELLDFLGGYSRQHGKLEKFDGRSALPIWLRIVVWNFLRRRPLPRGEIETPPEPPEKPTPEPSEQVAIDECKELFGQFVRAALSELPDRERLVLCLLHVDRLKLKDVARILGVHPGNAARRCERARNQLRELMQQHASIMQRGASYEACLELLMEEPKDFAAVLYEALEEDSRKECAR